MESLHTNGALVTRTEGTGIDVVFLHGWGMNSGAFTSFIPYLSDNFRVTTIDLPGFGENAGVVPSPYNVDSLARAIVEVLPEQCVLVGWSLGGLVAQKVALMVPEKLTGLVTIASTPRFIAGPGWPGIAADLLKMFETQLEKNFQKTLERFLAIQAMGSDTAKHDIKTIRQQVTQYPDPAEEALKKGLRILSTEDMRQDVGRIAVPTLRLYGRLDSLVPTSGIDQICELHPQSDVVVLPHASHAPFISHPQQTADILFRFAANIYQQKAS
ncbi:pimeloyl-ACP methyl ester esterase BioH [Alteromonas sp. McT4-15]|uniref:pimeloyl-ACP methyl ester esterase BioH n=1 Tax=Alteromonas sp. McT4-15 TaxID=2881256 RepID=UPI001CF868CC|nr:pimeloyl-ACP methyl ester esterase BioH [Alteromonas sp. McT4-15]MCB4434650.1 pimeloyl-ACP methyl ester esterase BioH [Alteromonas sp. McT4-15]